MSSLKTCRKWYVFTLIFVSAAIVFSGCINKTLAKYIEKNPEEKKVIQSEIDKIEFDFKTDFKIDYKGNAIICTTKVEDVKNIKEMDDSKRHEIKNYILMSTREREKAFSDIIKKEEEKSKLRGTEIRIIFDDNSGNRICSYNFKDE